MFWGTHVMPRMIVPLFSVFTDDFSAIFVPRPNPDSSGLLERGSAPFFYIFTNQNFKFKSFFLKIDSFLFCNKRPFCYLC